ncbi:TetR family transcriptional regulator [Nocardia otitidiscaviarum]|nr:TetR family transcriptional regulator [Nocardia otitidiscaviarum]
MNGNRTGPRGNRSRTRNTPLTRAAVLTAALEIIDEQGVEELSMRRLGEALGRDPMAIYRHATHKAAVLDGVAEVGLATYDGAEEFEHGLDILLTGFDSALSPPRAHP